MCPDPHPDSRYVHGTLPEEQARLATMNEILNERELPELRLAPGDTVLELGAGTGICAAAMARVVAPGGRVVAVERDEEQRAEARRRVAGADPTVDLRAGDAYDPPLAAAEWGTFDLVHCRFLLEHVPDPLGVVRVAARAARPGGRVVLADDDHELLRTWPEPPGLQDLWRQYWRAYERVGNDPLVGRKLVALLHEAGLRPTRNTSVFFGACAGHRLFPAVVENLAGVIDGARELILSGGQVTASELDTVLGELRVWGERPDAALWYGLSWAEGVSTTSC